MSSTLFIVSVVCALAFIPLTTCLSKVRNGQIADDLHGELRAVALLIMSLPSNQRHSRYGTRFALMALLGFPYRRAYAFPTCSFRKSSTTITSACGSPGGDVLWAYQGSRQKLATAFASFAVGVLHDLLGSTATQSLGITVVVAPIAAVFFAVWLLCDAAAEP
jgi:hypothetical protein